MSHISSDEIMQIVGPDRFQRIGYDRCEQLLRIPSREMILEAILHGIETDQGGCSVESLTVTELTQFVDQLIEAVFPKNGEVEKRINEEFDAAYYEIARGLIPESEMLTPHGLAFKRHLRAVWIVAESSMVHKMQAFEADKRTTEDTAIIERLIEHCLTTKTTHFPTLAKPRPKIKLV